MKKVLSFVLCTVALSVAAFAIDVPTRGGVPEIDANTAASAVALLSGALMMLRRRAR